jgi:Histidine kinase-, DNA gyrase B-, and HSP90-like ATPase
VSTTRRRRRGYIEQLPSGSWRAVVFAGSDPLTGRPRYVRETATSYDAAEVALTKPQRQVDEDQHPKTKIMVRQAVEQWLDVADVQDTTRERYEDLIRLYILPTFGETLAAKLPARRLRGRARRRPGGRGARDPHDDGRVRLEVGDSGPGVPVELRERIFERFARGVFAGRRGTGEGSGLGLVAQHIVRHRGSACVEDRPGGGARFVVELPGADQ